MVWTIIKPDDNKRLNKDTRWDRIRKKHATGLTMKTTLVKKFVEMDFIGKNNTKLMNGDIDVKQNLDPLLVMDLRHEMFHKTRKSSPSQVTKYKANIDHCIVHNMKVEEHYIMNELTKFREQLEKNRQRCKIRPKILNSDHFRLNNDDIFKSLENTTQHIEDFYEAPIQAMNQYDSFNTNKDVKPTEPTNTDETHIEDLYEAPIQAMNQYDSMDTYKDVKPTELTNTDETTKGHDDHKENIETRCVRFEESVGVVNYSREASTCSNTSNGIDSVISDLAEEALNEIKMEEAHYDDKDLSIQIEGLSFRRNFEDPLIVTKMLPDRPVDEKTESSDEEDESESNEQNSIIQQLFQAKSHSNTVILKNYFLKWIHYTTMQKIEKQNLTSRNDRIHQINAFLDHIRREKKNQTTAVALKPAEGSKIQTVNITKKYQSKIKIQQDIIDLQRMKLERQERLITALKLNKLSEEAKEAREEIKTELKNALRTGDSKSRAKVKCLQIMGNLRDEEDDEFARLQGKAMIQPKFLTNMQERALVRSVKHEQAKQRRLQQEAEREAAKVALEEAKRQEDEEAKRMRIELLKEKRRQEKMAKVLKERERQRAIENTKKSQQFCRNYLLRRVGMQGFKRLLQMKRENTRKVEVFRKQLLKKNVFLAWKNLYLLICERKAYMADQLHEKILKRRSFKAWTYYLREERSKFLVAVDWYELKLSERIFAQWCGYTKLQKLIEERKMKQAELHHEWHLKWKVVDRWERLPQILKLEKETEERRQRWRMKIWELLPDYTPNRDLIL